MTDQSEIKNAETTAKQKARLRRLGDQFAVVKFTEDNAKKAVEELKVKIRALVKEIGSDALDTENASSYMNLIDGQALVVTRTEDDPPPPVDPGRFLERLGPEQFFEFIKAGALTIPSKAFDSSAWTLALKEERVTESALADSLGAPPKVKAWSVGLTSARPE